MGQGGVNGNIEADPRWADPMAGFPDVGLAASSPCRDSASGCGTMGAGAELSSELVVYGVASDNTGLVDTIGDAIALIDCPAEIRLEDGYYAPYGNRNLNNQGRSFLLASRSGKRADCVINVLGHPIQEARFLQLTAGDNQVVLEGLTLEGGYALESGGLFYAPLGGNLVIRNCMLRGSEAEGRGGAIAMIGGHLTLEECGVEGNESVW